MTNKRLKKEERRKIIQNLAKDVFISKGYKKTTMQDIVNITGMSIGGLYHHYKNTTEILHDIMTQGNLNREELILEKLKQNEISLKLLSSIIVDKILANNDFIPLYVMFLQEIKNDVVLEKLYEQLKEESRLKMNYILKKAESNIYLSEEAFDILSKVIDSFIIGGDILNAKETFRNNRHIIEDMIENLLIIHIKQI